MNNSISRTTEIVLGILGVISSFIGAFMALFLGGVADAINGGATGVGRLGYAAFIFTVLGLISVIMIKKNRKVSAWGFIISAVGILISISMFAIVPAVLFGISGIMMLVRKVPKQYGEGNKANSENDNNIGTSRSEEISLPSSNKSSKRILIIGISVTAAIILVAGIVGSRNSTISENSKEQKYYIGDSVMVESLEYTVGNVHSEKLLQNEYLTATAQGTYCIVQVKIKNNDKESKTIDNALFKLVESDGTEYAPETSVGDLIEGNSDFFLNSLNPKMQMEGYIVFDVSDINSSYSLKVFGGMFSNKSELIDLRDALINQQISKNILNNTENKEDKVIVDKTNNTKEETITKSKNNNATKEENVQNKTKEDSNASTKDNNDSQEILTSEEEYAERGFPDYIEWHSITASSILKSNEYSYEPRFVTDWDESTAWAEGKDNDGIGEWIKFQSSEPISIQGIEISAGYNKSEEIYYKNNRVKTVEVEFSDGTKIIRNLVDEFQYNNNIDLENPIETSSIKIKVIDVYKGSEYQDTCISSIHAYR